MTPINAIDLSKLGFKQDFPKTLKKALSKCDGLSNDLSNLKLEYSKVQKSLEVAQLESVELGLEKKVLETSVENLNQNNRTLKRVLLVLGIGVAGFIGYQYYLDYKEREENRKLLLAS